MPHRALKALSAWWRELRARWAIEDIGYRVDGAPTSDEMAARCAELDRRRREAEQCARDAVMARDRALAALAPQPDVCTDVLTDDQVARLAWLIEEAGEVQQAAAKVLQHGFDVLLKPGKRFTRRMQLEKELGDLSAACATLYAAGDARVREVRTWDERAARIREGSNRGQ